MQRINFYSADLLPKRETLDFRRALLVVPVFALLLVFIVFYQRNALEEARLATQKSREDLQVVLDEIAKISTDTNQTNPSVDIETLAKQLQQQKTLLGSLQQNNWSHDGYSHLLIELSRYAESNIWLTTIAIDTHSVQLKGATLAPEKIPDWLATLQQQTKLSQVDFAQMQLLRNEDKPTLNFDVLGNIK